MNTAKKQKALDVFQGITKNGSQIITDDTDKTKKLKENPCKSVLIRELIVTSLESILNQNKMILGKVDVWFSFFFIS